MEGRRPGCDAAPHLLDPQVLVRSPGGLEQRGPFRGPIRVTVCHLGVKRHREPRPKWGLAPLPFPAHPAQARADRGAVALAQHSCVQLQLVQLGPQGLLVAPHVPKFLCQAICLLLDAQQVAGWGCRQ